MGDSSILTPGMTGGNECAQVPVEPQEQYLKKDYYLGEFESEEEKALARENLGVYSKENTYSKQESDISNKNAIKEAFTQHMSEEDPHGILPMVKPLLENMVKDDGSTPFKSPQIGVDPISDFHLVTKRFVNKLLNSHLLEEDPHKTLDKVQDILTSYVKLSQVYLKNQVYNTSEIDQKLTQFLRKDGSTPFNKPQMGVDPSLDGHLSTKRYVDQTMWNHLSDIDPHGFMSALNKRLAAYYKKSETYSRAETYSRTQIDAIIRTLVQDAANEAIQEHINQYDPHNTLAEVKKQGYVKQDGSTPFKVPQKGVEGVEENDLVTLSQLSSVKDQVVWNTSGPVQTTVGFVEDNSELPSQMSFQEIMDAIFYGKVIDVVSDPTALIGQEVDVKMTIRGTALISYAELYQGEELIGVFQKEDFAEDSLTVKSRPIYKDTIFTFKVYFNNTTMECQSTTRVSYGVFVGLLPQWYSGSNITYNYLEELAQEDSSNNKFYSGFVGNTLEEIKHKYNFVSPGNPKHLFLVVPKDYPDLRQMTTSTQQFTTEAFDIIDTIPLRIPGLQEDVLYKVYIYKQVLVTLDLEVTFKFEENE